MTRKYISISVAFAFLLFALGLMAQANSGQTSNTPSGTTSSQNPNSPAGDQMSMPTPSGSTSGSTDSHNVAETQSDQTSSSTAQSSQSGSTMGQSSQTASSGKAKTVEACVVREETDYFLVPKSGTPVRVSSAGTGDMSSHVGHRVKAHGTENMASNMGAGTSSQAGTSGTVATGGETSGSSAHAGEQGAGAVGSSTNPSSGTSGAAGTAGGTGALHAAANREIVVDRVDMVSETCPSNWNPAYNPDATKGKSKSDQSNY